MKNHPISGVDLHHHVQRAIVMNLRQNGPQSYSSLKPDGLEGNAYNYHLKILKQSGLIASGNDHYALTSLGQLVSDAYSFDTERLLLRPNFYLYPLVTSGDRVLVYSPSRPPLDGQKILPSGKLHFGESLDTCVRRELARRNILPEAIAWRPLCSVNIRYTRDGQVVQHRPGLIVHVEYDGELQDVTTANGVATWLLRSEVRGDGLPDMVGALESLESNTFLDIDAEYAL